MALARFVSRFISTRLLPLLITSALVAFAIPLVAGTDALADPPPAGSHYESEADEDGVITVDTSVPVELTLTTGPAMAMLELAASIDAASASITVGGLTPDVVYHLYEDDFHAHSEIATGAGGTLSFGQDITADHIVFIQPVASTKFIRNDSTGGDCASIGAWDAGSLTCTLTTDLSETVQIDSNGITLDGDGHLVSSSPPGMWAGIYSNGRSDITIENLRVSGFFFGSLIGSASRSTITNVTADSNQVCGICMNGWDNEVTENVARNNTYGRRAIGIGVSGPRHYVAYNLSENNDRDGITVSGEGTVAEFNTSQNNRWKGIGVSGRGTVVQDNVILNDPSVGWGQSDGISLRSASYHTIRDNTIVGNRNVGIVLSLSDWNTVEGNLVSGTREGIVPYFGDGNVINENTISSNGTGMRIGYAHSNHVYNNNFVANSTQVYLQSLAGTNYFDHVSRGGNYWDNYDEPAEGCFNADADDFCDTPLYLGSGHFDKFPWTVPDGWVGEATPPVVDAGPDQTVFRNTPILLSGTWTDEGGSDDNPYAWDWGFAWGTANYDEQPAMASIAFPLPGTHEFQFSVTDASGEYGADDMTVTVVNRPPDCDVARPTINEIWPPNDDFAPVQVLDITDPDGDAIAITITSIRQDEPVGPDADGTGVGTDTAMLRTERLGDGDGRTYHVGFRGDDAFGGTCDGVVRVGVKHDQGVKKTVGDQGPLYDSTTP